MFLLTFYMYMCKVNVDTLYNLTNHIPNRWANLPQKQSEGVRFLLIGTHTVPYCQKHTPTDCFFGDFAHWVY